jgi:3-dehydroquinate synthase
MIETVQVPLSGGRDYTIRIGEGICTQAGKLLAPVAQSYRAVIVSQPPIARHFGSYLQQGLAPQFGEVPLLTFPSGEHHKNLKTVQAICKELYDLSPAIDRKTLIIALGGGVVGDVVGFVASLYLRGLDFVQIPTTLLAMVDSSVGGKTGVDFYEGKNLLGAFHQPRAVLIDTKTLCTLPRREYNAGMTEVIKYGVIRDPQLLTDVQQESVYSASDPTSIIRRSCEIKADVVVKDEFETLGLRAILNYGHTVGHAIEAFTAYKRFKHGEAIAIGMMAAARIGEEYGITPPDIAEKIATLLQKYELPDTLPSDILPEMLTPLLGRDKKAEGGRAKFVLARQWGSVELISGIEEATILAGLRRICRDNSKR